MADWILVPCLVQLRSEFNAIGPKRDRASDGSIGDAAHEDSQSDHNRDETGNVPIRDADKIQEVHAIDVDKDGPWLDGITMEKAVQFILARCRSGAEKRLRYIIFNRRIWSASNGWRQKAYTGANPHDKHAHFSASYTTALEASKASWRLSDLLRKEAPAMTNPTPAQIAAHDVDPSGASQSWGGAAFTTLVRTGYLANTWAPAVSGELNNLEALVNNLQARIEDESDDMDALGASLVVIGALVGQVTNEPGVDPNVWYEVTRKAVADELNARGLTGPSA